MTLEGVELHLVDSFEEAQAFISWLGERRPVLAVDTETQGLNWWEHRIRLCQVGDSKTGWAFEWDRWSGLLLEALARYDGPVAMHNFKFDTAMFIAHGVDIRVSRIDDTRTMAHLIEPEKLTGLKSVSERWVDAQAASAGQAVLAQAFKEKRWDWSTVPIDFQPYWAYGALDTVLTARVWEIAKPMIDQAYRGIYDLEMAAQAAILDMELRGARIDLDYCVTKRSELLRWSASMRDWALETYGVQNLTSGQQVAKRMIEDGWEPTELTASGQPSTKKEVLAQVDHPLAKALLDVRHAEKMAEAYFTNLVDLADGDVVHAKINPIGARTGRMSVTDPALQTLPRDHLVRDAFIPREGNRLILIDYDQMELRLMAHFADELAMQEIILSGEDIHNVTAQRIYGLETPTPTKKQRQITKNAGYAKIYGAGASTFAATAEITEQEALDFLIKYDQAFPGVRQFQRKLEAQAWREHGRTGQMCAWSPYGRRHPVDTQHVYKLTNYLIQGTGADVLKEKIVALDDAGLGQYMILPVHDELVFDVPAEDAEEVLAEAKAIMTETERFRVPLTVDGQIVDRWGEKYREG